MKNKIKKRNRMLWGEEIMSLKKRKRKKNKIKN